MNRTQLTADSRPAPDPNACVQLELAADTPRLAQLHPDGVGNFARVIRGRMWVGGWSVPVAVKVQRDLAPAGATRDQVTAKFDAEHAMLARLADPAADPPVVRLLDLAGGSAADSLPPSLLCRLAAHALAPRCPQCKGELTERPRHELAGAAPHLMCVNPRCQATYHPSAGGDVADAILRASVGRDVACRDCPHRLAAPDACRKHAAVLNLLAARVLVLDRLDRSLADHLRRDDLPAAGPEWLAAVVDLFDQLVAAVEFLHGRGVAHLDLKPDNLCLRVDGPRPRLTVIDLGLSDDRQTAEYLRQAAGRPQVTSVFAAPEVVAPTLDLQVLESTPHPDGTVHLRVVQPTGTTINTPDPAVAVSDLIEVRYGDGTGDVGTITALPSPGGTGLQFSVGGLRPASGRVVSPATVYKTAGKAADLYSLGIVLAGLLTRGEGVGLRKALETGAVEAARLRSPDPLPNRLLVWLADADNPHLTELIAVRQKLRTDNYGEAKFLAEELLGMALRCVWRAVHGYTTGRADPAPKLAELRRDLERVKTALAELTAERQAKAAQQRREERVVAWHQAVPRTDPLGTSPDPVLPDDARRLWQAARLADGHADARELAGLRALYKSAHPTAPKRLADHLAVLADRAIILESVPLPNPPPAPPPLPPQPPVDWLMRLIAFAIPAEEPDAAQRRFLKLWETAKGDWRSDHQLLGERLGRFTDAARVLDRFAGGLEAIVLGPVRLAGNTGRAGGWVEVGPAVFGLFDPQQVAVEAATCRALADDLTTRLPQLVRQWGDELRKWERRTDLAGLPAAARERLDGLPTEHQKWRTQTDVRLQVIDRFRADAVEHLFPVWRADRGRFWVRRRLGGLAVNEFGDAVVAAAELLNELLGPVGGASADLALTARPVGDQPSSRTSP